MKHVEQRSFLFTTESIVTEMFPKTFFSHCVCSFVCLFFTWFVQLLTNKIQGLFKDKSWFSKTKIYAINQHSLTPS